MRNKYQQVQELISVTPEMEQRILARLTQAERPRSERRKIALRISRKAVLSFAACFALAIGLVVALPSLMTSKSPAPPVQIPLPIAQYQNLSDLSQHLAFPLYDLETLPDGYKWESGSVWFGEIAQLNYSNGTEQLTMRMAPGKNDVSGDYNTYTQIETVSNEYGEWTIKGSNGLYSLVIWAKDGYSFSISSSKPLSRVSLVELAEGAVPYGGR
ncbi:hypothetical protein [Gorillibacterium timonense]|uniref:hypothetical protein n=1 Tax=Gorillibacterium timonense TaxID=1689269 RepID=UPI00071C49C8|nr:hypothetical protein [Gorillibacterium timonense]